MTEEQIERSRNEAACSSCCNGGAQIAGSANQRSSADREKQSGAAGGSASAGRRTADKLRALANGGVRLIPATLALALLVLLPLPGITDILLSVAAYICVGWDVVVRAVRNIVRGNVFDEQLLMTIATLGAFAIGALHEAVAVMLFYQIGELLQDRAVEKSRGSIAALLELRPDTVRVERENGLSMERPEELVAGDIVVLRPGERLGVDGTVISGAAWLDTSAITGEPVPRYAEAGSAVTGGSVNTSSELRVRVDAPYEESTVARVLRLVENASERKARTEQFITRFARIYTPIVVGVAALLAAVPPLVFAASFSEWLHRSLVFLVVSCPCALVVSVPLSFFASIGAASRQGVLAKGAQLLERLKAPTWVVFDKTGTLTEGRFAVRSVKPTTEAGEDGSSGDAEAALLAAAASIEKHSNHPIATGICEAARARALLDEERAATDIEEQSGHGISGTVEGRRISIGRREYLTARGISVPEDHGYSGRAEAANLAGAAYAADQSTSAPPALALTSVHCAVDGRFAGIIRLGDALKADAVSAVSGLRSVGVAHFALFTGDRADAAHSVAAACGIEDVRSELLPEGKVAAIEELCRAEPNGTVVFVGDGMNDAPVLTAADVGVAMGGLGSDAAVEAADVVLATDQPSRLVDAVKISRRTTRIVWQNILLALGIKAAVLVAGALGAVSMWTAVIADVGVTLVAVANALRILSRRQPRR